MNDLIYDPFDRYVVFHIGAIEVHFVRPGHAFIAFPADATGAEIARIVDALKLCWTDTSFYAVPGAIRAVVASVKPQ